MADVSKAPLLKDNEIDNIFTQLGFSNSTIEGLAQLFAYSGFDVKVIISVVHFLHSFAQKNNKYTPTFQEDIASLLTLFLTRGTRISQKIVIKSTEEAKKRIIQLKTVYQLKDTGGATGAASQYGPRDLTLGRIAAAFAPVCTKILGAAKLRIVGAVPTKLRNASGDCLCWSGGASMIPASSDFDGVYAAWLEWALNFDKTVKPNSKEKGKEYEEKDEDRMVRIGKYGAIMRSNGFWSDNMRAKTLEDAGFKKDAFI